ncbi:MAG: DUF1287 domain-containing protein [Robiginitomaculum sp.]|nr:MAG: DUF1287 domain-containing protein [Robiginitomaculum sp.]
MLRFLIPSLVLILPLLPLQNAWASSANAAVVKAAQDRTQLSVRYDPKYVSLSYPNGDVPADTGVCTDVIIRTYRTAFGFDFQQAVHEDMRANFSAYPKSWGLKRPDKNIDHRRVPNLERFLKRKGAAMPITLDAKDYRAGDIVSWRLGGRLPHIGIVSDKKTEWGTPLIIHNVGGGVVEDDLLFNTDIHGHFRFTPDTLRAE